MIKYKIRRMKIQDTPEVLRLIAESFHNNDPSIESGHSSVLNYVEYYKDLIPYVFQWQKLYNMQNKSDVGFSLICQADGKIIASCMAIELHRFFQLKTNYIWEQFKLLKKSIDLKQHKVGTALYFDGLVVHKDYIKQGVGYKFLVEVVKYYDDLGFQFSYSFLLNPLVANRISRMGFQQILKEKINYKGFQFYVSVVKRDAKNLSTYMQAKL